MSYVYRHVRLDKNVPFYIGVGLKEGTCYVRAHNKSNRNKMWHGIVKKSGYVVEILVEGLTLEQAFKKEKEFIALYKRKVHGGTLVNLTDGGDGASGMFVSEETRLKMSACKKGKPAKNKGVVYSAEIRAKMSLNGKGRISHNKGKKMPPEVCANIKAGKIGTYKTGKNHPMYGRKMPESHRQKLIAVNTGRQPWNKGKNHDDQLRKKFINKNKSQQKEVLQISEGIIVADFYSVTFASFATGLPKSSIAKCAGGSMKICGGFTWKYKNSQA